MQTRLGDINTRVDDLTTKLKVLGLHASMNHEIKQAFGGNDARDKLVPKQVHANPHGQYGNGILMIKKIGVRFLEIIDMLKITV